jgi:hypothetical protein
MTATQNKIIGALGIGAFAGLSAVTAGLLPAIVTGFGAAALWFVGIYHPTPTIPPVPPEPNK